MRTSAKRSPAFPDGFDGLSVRWRRRFLSPSGAGSRPFRRDEGGGAASPGAAAGVWTCRLPLPARQSWRGGIFRPADRFSAEYSAAGWPAALFSLCFFFSAAEFSARCDRLNFRRASKIFHLVSPAPAPPLCRVPRVALRYSRPDGLGQRPAPKTHQRLSY